MPTAFDNAPCYDVAVVGEWAHKRLVRYKTDAFKNLDRTDTQFLDIHWQIYQYVYNSPHRPFYIVIDENFMREMLRG